MIQIDQDRLLRELGQLAEFSDAPEPAVTRVLFSRQDLAARAWLKERFAAESLAIKEDAVGNIFARWIGSEPELPVVGTGSHTDAIPHSGRYDGTVGVLGGLAAIRALRSSGFQPRRSIELLVFTAEEPTRFGVGCLGSRLLAAVLDPVRADALEDAEGNPLKRLREKAGYRGDLAFIPLAFNTYRAFVELHIEQGPELENQDIDIGVVTDIAAPASLRVTYDGTGGHAGATLMSERADALVAGAELVLAIENAALTLGGADTVATTGILDVYPRAVNSIPSRVRLEIDVRDIELARRDRVLHEIELRAQEIGDRRKQRTGIEPLNADPPATCDPEVVATIEDACVSAGLSSTRLISRAYHDSLFMALVAPTAMIFIPCRDGISHRPDEYSSPSAITAGSHTLALTLAMLSEN